MVHLASSLLLALLIVPFILWLALCPFHPHERECLLYKEPPARLEPLSMKGWGIEMPCVKNSLFFLFGYKNHQSLLAIHAQRNCSSGLRWPSTIAGVVTASSHLLPLVVRRSLLRFTWSRDPLEQGPILLKGVTSYRVLLLAGVTE